MTSTHSCDVGQRNEVERRHEATTGVLPADERLESLKHSGGEIDDRLVVEPQLPPSDRVAEVAQQLQPAHAVGRIGRGGTSPRPPVRGRSLERPRAGAEELGAVLGPGHRAPGDARPAARPDLRAADRERCVDHGEQARRDRGVVKVGHRRPDHGEPIPDLRQEGGRPERVTEPDRHHAQHLLAGVVSERLVDLPEIDELEHPDRHVRRAGIETVDVAEVGLTVRQTGRFIGGQCRRKPALRALRHARGDGDERERRALDDLQGQLFRGCLVRAEEPQVGDPFHDRDADGGTGTEEPRRDRDRHHADQRGERLAPHTCGVTPGSRAPAPAGRPPAENGLRASRSPPARSHGPCASSRRAPRRWPRHPSPSP